MTSHVVVGYTATKTGRDAVAFAARLARATGAVPQGPPWGGGLRPRCWWC